MVCMQNTTKRTEAIEDTNIAGAPQAENKSSNIEMETIDLDLTADDSPCQQSGDRLQLQHFAGSNIVSHPPLFSENGEYLMVINRTDVNVYSTLTGEQSRSLHGTDDTIVSMHFELKEPDILVACTKAGDVLRWNWPTGELLKKLTLPVDGDVLTFNLIDYYGKSETAFGFLTLRKAKKYWWGVYDLTNGSQMKLALKLSLSPRQPLVSVGTNSVKFIALASAGSVSFVNYKTWHINHLKNAHGVHITAVRVHPSEETVATGDEMGRIFLWRQFMSKDTVKTSLFHWHHTAITSIAFSSIGSSFYSSGLEQVLVKWNINRPEIRNFMPRMPSVIRQIAVTNDNSQVAVGTADNGVQIIGNENKMKCTLQDFTYIMDDNTKRPKFPIGLRFNPRTNTMVLNGRSGHIQFYSVHTRTLLYNMDVVMQNPLSAEKNKILYNIAVTKAAFNIDWIATGEVYNDEEHLPELRLKFWQFEEKSQSYVLNTNVELPHEGGFRAIEFSSEYHVDNLLCATVGMDNVIKMWALEETDDIYKKGKVVWYCVGQTHYKSLPIQSISFSQDGSLLAAGYGNSLCLYKSNNLKLKASLSGGAGLDGATQKAQVCIPKNVLLGQKKAENLEQRNRLLQAFSTFLENNDDKVFVKQLQSLGQTTERKISVKQPEELDAKQREYLYNKILQMHELNLFQKVLIYQKLGIRCRVRPAWQKKMQTYLSNTIAKHGRQKKTTELHSQVHRLNLRERFKAKHRLQEYTRRKQSFDMAQQQLVSLMSVLDLGKVSKTPQLTNGLKDDVKTPEKPVKMPQLPNIPETKARITHVQFAAGEYAHLVVVCTENRVLVWNLLTLRLQMVFKLSVKHLAFDPTTNLFAAITIYNELHVFQPHIAFPLYQRANMPELYGAAWLSRRYPKSCSLNLNWQAQSILYFLTENQEIVYLKGSDEDFTDLAPSITFANAAKDSVRYSIFGTFAQQQHTDKRNDEARRLASGPLVLGREGKNAVKSLVEMASHTMPPLSLFCSEFIKALVKPADSSLPDKNALTNGNANGSGQLNGNAVYKSHQDSDDDDDDDGVEAMDVDHNEKLKLRQGILSKIEELSHKTERSIDAQAQSQQLRRVAEQNIELDF